MDKNESREEDVYKANGLYRKKRINRRDTGDIMDEWDKKIRTSRQRDDKSIPIKIIVKLTSDISTRLLINNHGYG
jgi:hypothetical protein